jgi:hypothetical protein
MLRNRNSRHAKLRIAEIRNAKDILFLVIQCVQVNSNMIGGLLFHLTANCSVMIQLAEPNHGSWTVGVSVAEALF